MLTLGSVVRPVGLGGGATEPDWADSGLAALERLAGLSLVEVDVAEDGSRHGRARREDLP